MMAENGTEYFIICESRVVCKVLSMQNALFTMFSTYYTFNLDYPSLAKNIFFFFQDYILGCPDSNKKSGAYLATVSDIKRNL